MQWSIIIPHVHPFSYLFRSPTNPRHHADFLESNLTSSTNFHCALVPMAVAELSNLWTGIVDAKSTHAQGLLRLPRRRQSLPNPRSSLFSSTCPVSLPSWQTQRSAWVMPTTSRFSLTFSSHRRTPTQSHLSLGSPAESSWRIRSRRISSVARLRAYSGDSIQDIREGSLSILLQRWPNRRFLPGK